jgi:hypothetical protein
MADARPRGTIEEKGCGELTGTRSRLGRVVRHTTESHALPSRPGTAL